MKKRVKTDFFWYYLNSLTTELLSSGGSQLLRDPSELHRENMRGVSKVTTLPNGNE